MYKIAILVDLSLHKIRLERLQTIRLFVLDPKKKMNAVSVNGKPCANLEPEREIVEFKPRESRSHIVVEYRGESRCRLDGPDARLPHGGKAPCYS